MGTTGGGSTSSSGSRSLSSLEYRRLTRRASSPRCRLDGVYISVVTVCLASFPHPPRPPLTRSHPQYLRRGETVSVYAPTHLITFYRYLRFYHHGLAISLLTTDPPGQVVRRLNPTLRMSGLSFGRWRLRGDLVEVWGLEDPSVPEERRKYSLRMNCRFKSTARGRMCVHSIPSHCVWR